MLIDEAYKAGERSLAQDGSRTPEESHKRRPSEV